MNKIAILGAHGSGKTTLINQIHKAYGSKSITVIDIARVCPKLVGNHSNADAQQWIMEHQLALERIMWQNREPILFDNCSLGHLAYFSYWGGEIEIFRQLVVNSMSKFDKIFILPPNPSFLYYDGLRPTDIDFQKKIFNIQSQMLSDWKIQHSVYNPLEGFSLDKFIESMPKTDTENNETILCRLNRNGSSLALMNDVSEIYPILGSIGENETWEQAATRTLLAETGYLVDRISGREDSIARFELAEDIKFTDIVNYSCLKQVWLPIDKFDEIVKHVR